MNENYLWDKTGEPDEELQQLESLLSEFRYEPLPLVLPEEIPAKRWSFAAATINSAAFRYGAIAATVLLALGLSLWLGMRQTPQNNIVVVNSDSPAPAPSNTLKEIVPPTKAPEIITTAPRPQYIKYEAAHKIKPQLAVHRAPKKLSEEAQEKAAKEKVLYALQVTSKSLDLLRTKIQTDTN